MSSNFQTLKRETGGSRGIVVIINYFVMHRNFILFPVLTKEWLTVVVKRRRQRLIEGDDADKWENDFLFAWENIFENHIKVPYP